jgi:hypothetical protein
MPAAVANSPSRTSPPPVGQLTEPLRRNNPTVIQPSDRTAMGPPNLPCLTTVIISHLSRVGGGESSRGRTGRVAGEARRREPGTVEAGLNAAA